MSAVIRLAIGLALAAVCIYSLSVSEHVLAAVGVTHLAKPVAGISGVGAAIFLLLGVLELSRRSGREPNQPGTAADELRKLDALRQSGALTPQEFEAQKAKLL